MSKNRLELGQNRLKQRLEDPNRSCRKTQKNCRKIIEKLAGHSFCPDSSAGRRKGAEKCDLEVQVAVYGPKIATPRSGCLGGRFSENLSSLVRLVSVTCAIGPETHGS